MKTATMINPDFLTKRQKADLLQVVIRTVDRYIKDGTKAYLAAKLTVFRLTRFAEPNGAFCLMSRTRQPAAGGRLREPENTHIGSFVRGNWVAPR